MRAKRIVELLFEEFRLAPPEIEAASGTETRTAQFRGGFLTVTVQDDAAVLRTWASRDRIGTQSGWTLSIRGGFHPTGEWKLSAGTLFREGVHTTLCAGGANILDLHPGIEILQRAHELTERLAGKFKDFWKPDQPAKAQEAARAAVV